MGGSKLQYNIPLFPFIYRTLKCQSSLKFRAFANIPYGVIIRQFTYYNSLMSALIPNTKASLVFQSQAGITNMDLPDGKVAYTGIEFYPFGSEAELRKVSITLVGTILSEDKVNYSLIFIGLGTPIALSNLQPNAKATCLGQEFGITSERLNPGDGGQEQTAIQYAIETYPTS